MGKENIIVVIGSMNIDIAGYSLASLNYADSNPGKIKFTPGGVGRNIAENIALLGKESVLISAVGMDNHGEYLNAQTEKSGVNIDHIEKFKDLGTSSYISLMDNHGEMLVAINDMNIVDKINPSMLEKKKDVLTSASLIVLDCNLPQKTIDWIMRNYSLTPVFVDPVSAYKCVKIQNHLSRIHTLKPNRIEAETLSGIKIADRSDIYKVADWFHSQGLKRLVISVGADGVFYSEKNSSSGWLTPFKINVVNVTGAGDSMIAGLAACFVDKTPFVDSVLFAQACSSITLTSQETINPDLSVKNVKYLMECQNVL